MPATFLLYVFLISVATPVASTTVQPEWPSNIWVQPELRDAVTSIWHGSPTFRAQCLKIGASRNYHVHVVIDPSLGVTRRCRAQCILKSFSTGLVIARVALPDRHDLTELIPHEFEHITEHIDGVNLRRNVQLGVLGAYEAGEGRIETARATNAGRRARSEMLSVEAVVTRR